jgi:hypothetical protein
MTDSQSRTEQAVSRAKYEALVRIATRYEVALTRIADSDVPGVIFAEDDVIAAFAAAALEGPSHLRPSAHSASGVRANPRAQ